MVTVFHHTPVNAIYTVFKQFDWLNFDDLAGKRQKRQNVPSKFPVKIFRYTVIQPIYCIAKTFLGRKFSQISWTFE